MAILAGGAQLRAGLIVGIKSEEAWEELKTDAPDKLRKASHSSPNGCLAYHVMYTGWFSLKGLASMWQRSHDRPLPVPGQHHIS
jgi:hypothetical protein